MTEDKTVLLADLLAMRRRHAVLANFKAPMTDGVDYRLAKGVGQSLAESAVELAKAELAAKVYWPSLKVSPAV